MRKDGMATREKILDAAQVLMLDRGYAGMTVDQVLDRVGITKGAFFHHFKTKEDLAKSLLQRFNSQDEETFAQMCERSENLSDDPLQQVLIFVRLTEEMFSGLTDPYPGCLFASYIYGLQQFDDATRAMIRAAFARWRQMLQQKFETVMRRYPPRSTVSPAHLADAFTVVLEGAFITGKAMNEPNVVVEQLRLYRNYIELLFGAQVMPRRTEAAVAAG